MNLVDYEKYYHSGSQFIIPRDEFEKIIEENQRLNDDIKILFKENEAKEKVIIKYDNVLNELEKIIQTCIYGIEPEGCSINFNCEYDSEEDYISGIQAQERLNTYKFVLEQINELKESDK